MHWYSWLLVLVLAYAITTPSQAGLFGKRSKVNPAERVEELITTVRTAKEEHKRASAVEELRQFDGAAFPQIGFVLIDVLKTDASTNVRMEAVHSLGKLRPVTRDAALALEEAASKDSSLRVRWQARTSVTWSHLNRSYPAAKTPDPKGTDLGPAAGAQPGQVGGATTPAINPLLLPVPGKAVQVPALPPAMPMAQPAQIPVARPLPRGPMQVPIPPLPAAPAQPPPPSTVPVSGPPSTAEPPVAVPEEGPSLAPPP